MNRSLDDTGRWPCWRCRAPARGTRGTPGTPDVIVVSPGGLFVGLEIKTGRGGLTLAQRQVQAIVRARGGEYEVVREVDEAVALVRRLSPAAAGVDRDGWIARARAERARLGGV